MSPATRRAIGWCLQTMPADVDERNLVIDELILNRSWIFNFDGPHLTHEEAFEANKFLHEKGIVEQVREAPPIVHFKANDEGAKLRFNRKLAEALLQEAEA